MPQRSRLPRRTFLANALATAGVAMAPRFAHALPGGQYQVQPQYWPTDTGGVNQQLIRETPAYIDGKGSRWWTCGHAALLSAINFMRQGTVSKSQKITQLQWVHERLVELQPGYASSANKEASIDALLRVIKIHKNEEFAARKIHGLDRAKVRDGMLETLRGYSAYVIALTQIEINGTLFDHFVAIHKIDYQPGTEQGGTAYYWDPYRADFDSMGLAMLMNGMHDAGTVGRHSFIRLFRR